MKYVALLRGINVGKSVQIPMKKLKEFLEGAGFVNVQTYLNSGNAIFESSMTRDEAASMIEDILEGMSGKRIPTLLKTSSEMISIAGSIPEDWRNDASQQTYVAYLFKEASRPGLVDELPIKKEHMEIFFANDCLVWNIKRENYNKSRINSIVGHAAYGYMTTRNSNTARKLAELCSRS